MIKIYIFYDISLVSIIFYEISFPEEDTFSNQPYFKNNIALKSRRINHTSNPTNHSPQNIWKRQNTKQTRLRSWWQLCHRTNSSQELLKYHQVLIPSTPFRNILHITGMLTTNIERVLVILSTKILERYLDEWRHKFLRTYGVDLSTGGVNLAYKRGNHFSTKRIH